ncbi:MAG: DoxX family protein [Halobacteriales archaeon]|nr:DoxX family protein [Halobacteriales archaeon]
MSPETRNNELARWGPTFARLALGIPLLVAGIGKIFAVGPKASGIEGFTGMLAGAGVPLPTVFAWLVGIIEVVGGALLLVGALVRVSALLGGVIMLAATVLIHIGNGYPTTEGGFELTLALFFVALSLVVSGPGRLSVEHDVLERELVPLPESVGG